jgi:predicted ester cyclase
LSTVRGVKQMDRDDLRRLAASWVEAFNNDDWERLREPLAPEVTHNLLEVTHGVDFTKGGRTLVAATDDFMAAWRQVRTIAPDLRFTDVSWIVDESKDTAIGMLTWNGTDIRKDTGTSGRRVEIPGILLFTVIDGRITQILEYGDWWSCPQCVQ